MYKALNVNYFIHESQIVFQVLYSQTMLCPKYYFIKYFYGCIV